MGKAQVAETMVCRAHIGAAVPGATTAIEDDEPVFRRRGHRALKQLQPGGLGTWACIDGAGNVRLRKKDTRTNLEHQRPGRSRSPEQATESVGLDQLRLGYGVGAGWRHCAGKLRPSLRCENERCEKNKNHERDRERARFATHAKTFMLFHFIARIAGPSAGMQTAAPCAGLARFRSCVAH
jgi:hypothetical protein